MSTSPAAIETNTWPEIFTHPRQFDRATENKAYLTYVDEYQSESEGDDRIFEDDDENDSETDGEGQDAEVEEDDLEETGGNLTPPVTTGSSSTVRELATRLEEQGGIGRHPEEEDVVADFVEHSIDTRIELLRGATETLVAFVEDQSNTPTNTTPGLARGRFKRYRSGTRMQLRQHLSSQRFAVTESSSGDDNSAVQVTQNVNRRSIYLPDLDALEIETLAATVTLTQRVMLLDILDHHVKLSPSIALKISSTGFRLFNLRIHLPYFALRRHEILRRDPRERRDGRPLRDSWLLNFIPALAKDTGPKAKFKWCLYDAQRSMTLLGIDDKVWTVICIMDTFFDGERPPNLEGHDQTPGNPGQDRLHPISREYLPGTESILDSRRYFLAVLEMWMVKVSKEYEMIARKLEEVVGTGGRPTEASGQMRKEFDKWNDDVLEHPPKIMKRLSDCLNSWRIFERENLSYFPEELKQRYLPNIRDSFHKLEESLKTLQETEALAKANSKTVSKGLGFENHAATVNVQVLAILAVIFSPLSHVTAMFNMQGLPFSLNVLTFGSSFVAIMIAYITAYCLVQKWHTIKPFPQAWSGCLILILDIILAKAREGLNIATRAFASKAEVSELPGSQPVATAPSVQAPLPRLGPKKRGTWSSMLSFRRKPSIEEYELSADV